MLFKLQNSISALATNINKFYRIEPNNKTKTPKETQIIYTDYFDFLIINPICNCIYFYKNYQNFEKFENSNPLRRSVRRSLGPT